MRLLADGFLLHPLGYCSGSAHQVLLCRSYNFWSGIGSDISEITLLFAIVGALLAFWRHHNCHVTRCWRLSWHPHPDSGHPVCRRHHPDYRGRS